MGVGLATLGGEPYIHLGLYGWNRFDFWLDWVQSLFRTQLNSSLQCKNTYMWSGTKVFINRVTHDDFTLLTLHDIN